MAAQAGLRRLLRILPNMHILLLGANRIQDTVALHYLFWDESGIFCTHHGWCEVRNPNPLARMKAKDLPDLSKRLTTIEFPAQWTQLWNGKAKTYMPWREDWELCDFGRLTKVTLSGQALFSVLESEYLPFASPDAVTDLVVSNIAVIEVPKCLKIIRDSGCFTELERLEVWTHEDRALETLDYDEIDAEDESELVRRDLVKNGMTV
jgi:hypothetical protein